MLNSSCRRKEHLYCIQTRSDLTLSVYRIYLFSNGGGFCHAKNQWRAFDLKPSRPAKNRGAGNGRCATGLLRKGHAGPALVEIAL